MALDSSTDGETRQIDIEYRFVDRAKTNTT